MGYFIAITGKGGTGKTTISGLIVLRLIARWCRPVLAVDADPNTCLDVALGVQVKKTIGSVREEAREAVGQGMASGISKQQLLELKIAESLVEAKDFDLIAMGRPEGPGCYCYANNVLKSILSEISSSYPYIVLDNEAGLENLSRRIVQKVDLMIMVADPSRNGLETVNRLYTLAKEMKIKYDKLAIIINRLRSRELPPSASELQRKMGADFLFGLPDDAEIAELAENGTSLLSLPERNRMVELMDKFLDEVVL
ncbi:MAG TPA: AAA family ATPase, partial [bacterium]